MKLYGTVTNCTSLINISISESHSSSTTTAIIVCESTTLSIGDSIQIDLGYVTDHDVIFTGYVKIIEQTVPDNIYTITATDVLIRAVDYFIVSANPDTPFSRQNIAAEDLVEDVLNLAGITNYTAQATSFTLAINSVAEVNLISSYDYSKSIADIVAWHLWAGRDGTVYFKNRKPYVMTGASGQPGDVADTPISGVSITDIGSDKNILSFSYIKSETELRNRIVVQGGIGIYAEASASSPYLPAGFYKTVLVANQIIDTQSIAEDSASYNLAMLNRLTKRISASVIGDHRLQARRTVDVDEQYTGIDEDCYIYACSHQWSSSGYTVQLELRL